MSKVELYRDEAGEWRWRRRASNGQVVSVSGEGYVDRTHAREMAAQLNPDIEIVEPQ
jgi:uncharacterized protein YegP (UPF0339 family)